MSYCDWDTTDELCLHYHDEEWGVPLHDDRGQFEFLSLEVMQCGLNWTMMLRKREVFRACFTGFDYDVVAAFGSFDAYLWGFSGGKTILYNKHADGWIPVSNGLSARVAADLRKRGFK